MNGGYLLPASLGTHPCSELVSVGESLTYHHPDYIRTFAHQTAEVSAVQEVVVAGLDIAVGDLLTYLNLVSMRFGLAVVAAEDLDAEDEIEEDGR